MFKKEKEIFLDYASITPISKESFLAMKPWLDGSEFGNPSSVYDKGKHTKRALAEFRKSVQQTVNAKNEDSIVFTSGGTESNTLAIQGFLKKNPEATIVTSPIEHPSVRSILQKHEETKKGRVIELDVDGQGVIFLDQVKEILSQNLVDLITIMTVNNVMGAVQPISEIAQVIKKNSPHTVFHTDASQAPLYLSVDVQRLGVDMMSLCGQKIYGPQGSGCLYIKERVEIEPLFIGGKQEFQMRAGTEPMHQIAGFTKALSMAQENKKMYGEKMYMLRDYFKESLENGGVIFKHNGGKESLPLATNISFPKTQKDSEEIISFLNVHNIFVSSHSACMGSIQNDPHVIVALGATPPNNSIRFSFGSQTTKKDIDTVVSVIKRA